MTTPVATIPVDEDEFLKGYDQDLRELYTRLVLALEAWEGQTDAKRAALWHAIYDTQRENHDLRMKIAEERHDFEIVMQELRCVGHIPLGGLNPLNRTTEGLDAVKWFKSFAVTSRTRSYPDT
ncbi:hypothetical protein Tco_0005044 [Tanacetum coccineum]